VSKQSESSFRLYGYFLKKYYLPQLKSAVLLLALLLSVVALQLAAPQVLRAYIDGAEQQSALRWMYQVALLYTSVVILNQLILVVTTYIGEKVAWKATNELRTDLLEHCLKLDSTFHSRHQPAELIERIDGDAEKLSNLLSQFLVVLFSNLLLLVGVLVLLFRENWIVGLLLTVFVIVALFSLQKVRSLAVPHWVKVRQQKSSFFGLLGEQLAGLENIRSNGAPSFVMRSFLEQMKAWLPVRMRAQMASITLYMTVIGVFALGHALAFSSGMILWSKGLITVGTVYMIFNYTELLRRPIEQIRTQLNDLQIADACMKRIDELMRTTSKLRDGTQSATFDGELGIRIENVSFAYQEGEPVIKNVHVAVGPKRVLGVLGRSGSGKSTLARLLMRFYDPTEGCILFNGEDIRQFRMTELRQSIGMVTQDVQLFHATIRDNLTFFDDSISDEQILSVISELGLTEWFDRFPAGLDTVLEGGNNLSAGEGQLLALCRVFFANPSLIVLDEPSSRLDAATGDMMERALQRLIRGRTAIIIAHRLTTIEHVDEILIMNQGAVLEYGLREELSADPNTHFSHLLKSGEVEELLA